ncbi:MAG: toprim domain-containing protein, partial [bacterium]|nr:toprim domain-containing protein [bacterium]
MAIGVGRGGVGAPVTRVYDRFRHRLMFPIHDAMGRVVGFTGRILDGGTTVGKAGDVPAKYVNTPETALYKKGSIIYGLWYAKDAIRTAGCAILVEGQTDVIACHGANLTHTVATSGTAFTPEQLRLLKRYTSTLRVAFDADPAGEGAAERGIDAALDAGFDVRVIRMPTDAAGHPIAKDADECIKSDVEAWRRAVEHPVPVLDYYTERVRQRFDLRTPAGKRDAGRVLVAHVAHVVDSIERAAWVRRIAEAIGVPEASIREAIEQSRTHQPPAGSPPPQSVKPSLDPRERLANRLLALCIRFPDLAASTLPSLSGYAFPTETQQQLYNHLLVGYT